MKKLNNCSVYHSTNVSFICSATSSCGLSSPTLFFQPDSALKTEGAAVRRGVSKTEKGMEGRGAGQSRLNSSGLGVWRWNPWLKVWRRISWAISLYWRKHPISWFFAPIANRARLPVARECRHNAWRRAAISCFWKLGYIGKYSAAIRSIWWADEAQLRDVSGFSHCWPRWSSPGVVHVEWWLKQCSSKRFQGSTSNFPC